MKDVREKFSGVDDEELDTDMDLRRAGKAAKLPPNETEKEIDELASSIYEFMYASDSSFDAEELF